MICAVSVALVMLEWIRTSYWRPSDASRCPVSSACSRPESGHTHTEVTSPAKHIRMCVLRADGEGRHLAG